MKRKLAKDLAAAVSKTSGSATVDLAAAEDPDVVIMDIAMPQLNGVEATRQINLNLYAGAKNHQLGPAA